MSCCLCGAGCNFLVAVCAGGPLPSGGGLTDGRAVASSLCVTGWCGVVPGLWVPFLPLRGVRRFARVRPTVSSPCFGAVACSGVPCCVPLCFAVLCRGGLCCVAVRPALTCRGMAGCAVLCCAVPCCAVLCRVVGCLVVVRCGMPCCLVLCRALLCRGVWWALFTAVPAPGGVGAG